MKNFIFQKSPCSESAAGNKTIMPVFVALIRANLVSNQAGIEFLFLNPSINARLFVLIPLLSASEQHIIVSMALVAGWISGNGRHSSSLLSLHQ